MIKTFKKDLRAFVLKNCYKEGEKTMKPIMSIFQTAKEFGIGRDKLRAMVRNDPPVPTIKIGQKIKINTELFQEWLNEKTKNGEAI